MRISDWSSDVCSSDLNNSLESNLESYGIFGEVYFDLSDRLTLTGGLRYNNDKKDVTARTTLISFLNPYANDGDPFDTPITPLTGPSGLFDADPGTPGQQLAQFRAVSFRSEEHTSELQSLMRISYALFGWTQKKN